MEATICPSKDCSACACIPHVENETSEKEEQRIKDGRSISTYMSSDFKHCTDGRHRCMVDKHEECCLQPLCETWNRGKRNWKVFFNNNCFNRFFEGKFATEGVYKNDIRDVGSTADFADFSDFAVFLLFLIFLIFLIL